MADELDRRKGRELRTDDDVAPLLAAGKGQLALLVTDAAGRVIAGIRATGGLTQLQYRPGDGTWEFAGAFSGPEVLEGSYALRNNLGTDPEPEPDDGIPPWSTWSERHGRGRAKRPPGALTGPVADTPLPLEDPDPFVCPRCGAESYHPEDKRRGYCGRCHEFTAPPEPVTGWGEGYPDDAERLRQGRRLAEVEGREPPERVTWARSDELPRREPGAALKQAQGKDDQGES